MSADDLVAGARALLAQTQDDMAKTAIELWPIKMSGPVPSASTPDERKAIVRQVLAKLADDHPTNLTILDDAKRLLGDATSFVRDHDLVGLPDAPCQLIEMPEYKRGVAIAYCDSTGPLEQKPETFYAISPTPTDWPPERALSFYREYNSSMLVDLTVHEAMPGHYLQAMHANRFKSDVRAVFSNGSFVEGWAVYGEWLMTKYGFGGAAVRLQRQKMLARVAANAILDHEIHAGLMDEEAALALMKNEAFQEDGEAVAKWRRARLTSGQLSTYYYGFRELMKLRAEAEGAGCFKRRAPEAEGIKRRAPEAEGSNGRAPEAEGINERAYHDKLLSFGSPAPRYLHALMATP